MSSGAGSFPAAGSATEWAGADDIGSGGGDSDSAELGPEKEEGYIDLLLRASLLLVSKDFPPEVQQHGTKMLQHLLKFRREELSSADLLSLTLELVAPHGEADTSSKTAHPKEQNKYRSSLLMLATNNNLRSLAAEETGGGGSEDEGVVDTTTSSKPTSSPRTTFLSLGRRPSAFGGESVDFSLALDPNFHSSPTSSSSSSPPMPFKNLGQRPWVSEDERIDLSIALSCLEDSPNLCYPSYSYFAPYSPRSFWSHGVFDRFGRRLTHKHQIYQIDHPLEKKNLSYSVAQDPRLHSLPFPIDGPVPISCFGLGLTVTDNGETISCHQGMGSLLLVEHNFLCEAFIIATSCSGIQQYLRILPCLLNSLNKIWTQMEWNNEYLHSVSGLTRLFSDVQFLKMAYHVVKFCEENLKRSKVEESDACDICSVTLLQSILPLLLRLLQCIHALWNANVPSGLSEELEGAKSLSSVELAHMLDFTDQLYNIDNEACFHENETRALLEGIRQRVYNVIGLCTSIEGAFSELLDSLSVSVAFMKDLWSMEFRHLGKLIRLVIIPLVKHCPRKFWKEWVTSFLQPLLSYCEDMLHFAWFSLLYHGRADTRYYFGNLVGLDEKIKELEQKLLLVFTREVSGLLGVLALAEQNIVLLHEDRKVTTSLQDLESMSSSSLFRFLLLHDCFGSLRMSLFGYFVDDEATTKAIPFCRSLICLAVATNDVKLGLFIVNDLLPCLIRRLDNQLQCAIQRLIHKLSSSASDSASRDLVILCRELYGYLLKQDLAGEGKDSGHAENNFTVWLAKQKEDLQVKASSAAKELPEGFEWNWEFEDEFQRYIPTYMDMLQEVDAIAMDDNVEGDYWKKETLFQKLKPEFRSKYAINSCVHPYMTTISSLRQQKFYMMGSIIRNRRICGFVRKLIKLKPYIKGSDCPYDVIKRLKKKSEIPAELSDCVAPSVELLIHFVLFFLEPRFHPLIREGHIEILFRTVYRLTRAREREGSQQLVPDIGHFPLHLQSYARAFVETKLKESMYSSAIEQIRLHEEFDKHLASGELDHRMDEFMSSKDDFVKDLVINEMATTQFLNLNYALIKLSFERRAEIVEIQREVCTYSECLRGLLENEPLRDHLKNLMNELETEGFFDTDHDSIDWEKRCFTELVDEFNDNVFAGHSLPKHYVISGIIDYRFISRQKRSCWPDAFEEVVHEVRDRWIDYCEQFWMETRYYEHLYYDIVRKPFDQVFCVG